MNSLPRISIGISACLLGEPVRYDGGQKLDHYLAHTLGQYVRWVPVCPEVESGLPVPREPMKLVGAPGNPRLLGRSTRTDFTPRMQGWMRGRLDALATENLAGFVFKSRSPSSGLRGVKVHAEDGTRARAGMGIFARAFTERFPLVPAEDDERLHDPCIRGNFIERVCTHAQWRALVSGSPGLRGLVDFHARHKYLIMAHSPRHYRELGPLVGGARAMGLKRALEAYGQGLAEAMSLMATHRKHANVLEHITGYFKTRLTPTQKEELVEAITHFRKGYVPLIVPVTLLNHYTRTFGEDYLAEQVYLNPLPVELMLQGHV